MDYPQATTQDYGYDTNGRKIHLRARGLETTWDIAHTSTAFFAACDGTGKLPGTDCKMDGWNNERSEPNPPPNAPYAYVPETEIKPYWTMAQQYVLGDQMFASNLDGSFVAHQYVVAGYASRTVDFPTTQWGCEGGQDRPGWDADEATEHRPVHRRLFRQSNHRLRGRRVRRDAGASTPG